MHSINATILRKEDVPEKYSYLFRKTAHPDFFIAATSLLVQHGWDNSSCRHADISTDYFGGAGSQYASYFEPDTLTRHFPDRTKGGAINSALDLLGVPPMEGRDLFDVLELSRFRNYEDLTPNETPIP
jgi:hypothetical protein